VALRKAEALLTAGADLTLVSPEAVPELRDMAAGGRLRWRQRRYGPEDLEGCFLVVGATGDAATNQAIYRAAEAAGRLCNIVDVPDLCSFILPAILRRGEVTVAVSTSGASPTLAQQIRDRIAGVIGEEYGMLAALLREIRPHVHEAVSDEPGRRAAWRRAVGSRALDLLREGRTEEARATMLDAASTAGESGELEVAAGCDWFSQD
jgi:siroheme synthase-like protein